MTRVTRDGATTDSLQESGQDHARLKDLCIFMADLGGGGAERMMVAIANGMASRGALVRLVIARATGPYLSEVDDSVVVVDLASRGVTAALPGLVSHLRNHRPEVLLTTLAHTSVVAVTANVLAGKRTPIVLREANTPTTSHMSWAAPKTRLSHFFAHLAYRAADGVIAVSDGVAHALQDVVGVPAAKIATLYNPVVTPDLESLAAEDPGHDWFEPGQPPVILGVGSLTARKDFATLIKAFELLAQTVDARLVILGEGPERSALEALISRSDVADSIDMPGFKQNPFSYMARAAVYVLSSHREGLPGSLVQALACGCPSVATDCPSGPREILQDGAIGPLVDVGDAPGMAGAIQATLGSPPAREVLTSSVAKYDSNIVLDHVYHYLSSITSARRLASRQPV